MLSAKKMQTASAHNGESYNRLSDLLLSKNKNTDASIFGNISLTDDESNIDLTATFDNSGRVSTIELAD